MRWFVEVSSLGKTDLQKFCVEAESWQRALQSARAQRGEEGPMSGFSIELLEEGYRAVDPVARIRFVVKRAPDDAPVTTSPSTAPKSGGIAPSRPSSGPPASGDAKSASSVPPAKSIPPRPAATAPSAPVVPVAPVAAPAPAVTAQAVGSAVAGLPPVKVLSSREQDPTDASPLTYREYSFVVPTGTSEEVAVEVLRAQLKLIDASLANAKMGKLVNLAVFDAEYKGKAPPPVATLTWKDWKGAPVIGYPRRGATQKQVKPPSNPPPATTSQAPAGVFPDPSTVSQPPPAVASVSPLSAAIPSSIPQSPFAATPSSIPPPAFLAQPMNAPAPFVPSQLPPGSIPPPAPAQFGSVPPPAPVQLGSVPPPPPAPFNSVPPPPPAAFGSVPPPPPAPFNSAPPPPPAAVIAPSQPPPAMPAPAAFPSGFPGPAPVIASAPSAPPSSSFSLRGSAPDGTVRTPSGRYIRGRTTGDELITQLFESMHDLHFLRDALDGGQFCLALATEVLPSRAAIIHFFDVEKREWMIACTRGKDTSRLLTLRTPESDELLREAARVRRAVVKPNGGDSTAQRYQSLGSATQSVIIAPIMQAGRALGAIELINPLDGMPFNEDEGNAMTYIAEQYAEYLGSRGIVLDQHRIQASAAR